MIRVNEGAIGTSGSKLKGYTNWQGRGERVSKFLAQLNNI
jgi:hypothetical protein